MENEIVVRKYADLKPFFEQKSLQCQIDVNELFVSEIDKTKELIDKAKNISSIFANGAAILDQAKTGEAPLQALLTPEMREALKNGRAKLCYSNKDGNIFPKIQYNDGNSEFISLKGVEGFPNYGNITVLVNQMQMQQTLTTIQNTLTDFAEETDRQLSILIRDNHDDKILKAESAKLNFESFLKGELSKDFVINSINNAFPAIRKDIKRNLADLKEICDAIERKITFFGMKKQMEKEQELIFFVLESVSHLQVLCNIEMYLAYIKTEAEELSIRNNKLFEIQGKYSDVLIECFTKEKLELLSGLSTFPEDIWRNNFMPNMEKLKSNMKEALIWQNNVQENIMEVV